MAKKKKLSNPFSTGGGGVHFEAHVQASFVVLMLTGGNAPCLPCWPIKEIKLQGKIDGFDTDDFIVFVEDPITKKQRKLLGQVKHSIAITPRNPVFGEVMQAAWNDYNNPKIFTRGKDSIALITGPLSLTDGHNVQWLLNQARHTKNVDEFFRNVQQSNFSPSKSVEKLKAFQHHLREANGGSEISRDELYDFLKHFYLLGYDLGNEFGVVLSLLYSHISQFQQQHPKLVWSNVVEIVQIWNKDAGTITPTNIQGEFLEAFKQKSVIEIPEELKVAREKPKTDWAQHPDANYLALAVLIGSWQDKSQGDNEVITQFLGISYDEWLKKAQEILHWPDSPLSLRNGNWKVVNRGDLWCQLGPRILDQNLDIFRSLAVSILKENDPAFELSVEERYAASIHGKELKYSHLLRNGIAEGLAVLGSHPETCVNCSQGKAETICMLVVSEILYDADWVLWGSLNSLLPLLAEASPDVFLKAIEKTIYLRPCPFDELFSQESNGITGTNYLTGLLWALETLAWDEQYLVRVYVSLAELANYDPGGKWVNRPSNSLATILLPWYPQTLASVEKQRVAVQTILKEQPEIAWDLIVQLLPNQHQTTLGSKKPIWRKIIPDDWKNVVSHQAYWDQGSFYAQLAVEAAGHDTVRLSILIDHFDDLPEPAFDQLLNALASQTISELPEEQRLLVWSNLIKFTNNHRRFNDSKWALPDELITRIEQVAEHLAPISPFNLYQNLFTDDFDEYDDESDWVEKQKLQNSRQEKAILIIFKQNGIDGVMRFAESVASPEQVGNALSPLNDALIEQALLPELLAGTSNKLNALVSGYIWRSYQFYGWDWCDKIDKADWKPEHIGQFLAYLPFKKETWDRAAEWLQDHDREYWTRTSANAYQIDENLSIAIDKLIEHRRPLAAIHCLNKMLLSNQILDTDQCVRALLAAITSSEPNYSITVNRILKIIKFLQTEPTVNQEDLYKVEWAYIPLLNNHKDSAPRLLENRLASDPEFFCEIIQLIYRSKKEDQIPREPTEESITIAKNAWRLLHKWKLPPGTLKDGTFSEEHFNKWLQKVKEVCTETGHLEVALIKTGEVLIYTPPDSEGLWIRRDVAAALNDRESEDMRTGFSTGAFNSRGTHWVDPTGRPERGLAKQYREKAEKIEDAGFHRFAVTLRSLSSEYDRQADQIIEDQELRDNQ